MKATIETATLYHVTSNTELNEGRGSTTTIGWFLDRGIAELAAKGRYVMGTDCPIVVKTCEVVRADDGAIYLLGSKIDVSYESAAEVRKRALNKLTPDERRALGFG